MDTEENKAVQNEAEDTAQVESPPTEVPEATAEQTKETSDDLPTDTEEQRKAFQEMRQEIKRLKEETKERQHSESAFDVFRPKSVPEPDINQYQTPEGQVNWAAYQQAVSAAARSQADISAREQLDEFKARQKHPDLFADSDAEEEVASRYLFAKMRGENVTVSEIADKVAKRYGKAVTKAEQKGAEKMLTEVASKEQAALATPAKTSSQAQQALSDEELENLKLKSRGRGRESDAAVAERLKNIPYK